MSVLVVGLSVAALVTTIVAYFVDDSAKGYIVNAGWLLAAFAAVAALIAARARSTSEARSAWTLLVAAAALWAFGQVLWTVWLFVPLPASPSAADFAWYGFAVLAGLGLHRLGWGNRPDRSMTLIEIIPLIVAVCALIAALVWDNVTDSPLNSAGIAAALAYPVLYVSAAIIVLQSVISGAVRVRGNPGLTLIVLGLVIEAIAFILWCPLLLDFSYVAGTHACDLLWTVGLVLIAVGACYAGPVPAPDAHRSTRLGAVLPAVTLAALVGTQIYFIVNGAEIPARLALAGGVAFVSVALLIRGDMIRRDQAQLLERERRASAEAVAARKELDGFFELSIGLLGVANFDGRFTRLNPSWTEVLGWSLDELMASPFIDFVHPDDVEKTLDEMKSLAGGGETLAFENRYRCKDGSYRWLAWKTRPDMDAEVIYASAHDVTEMRELSSELVVARDQALEASRQKSEFLAMMSHEIRTPLNGVIGMTNLLSSTDLDPEQRGYAETVASSGEGLLTIINDILDFSKIEAGQLELDPIDFNARTVVEEVGEQLASRAHERGLELALDVSENVPELVHGDPVRLRQILINLVGNAIKFTEAGEVLISARAERSAQEVLLRFEVRDTGLGIEPDQLPRLFESFTQADSSTTRRFGGSGLGLAICKRLAERMGGEIGATSKPNAGSTFWFTVPTAPAGEASAREPRLDFAGVRVLVVDDNATNREILEHQLRTSRMRPETAEDAASALRRLRSATRRGEPHELVLLDFNMPGMDGIELAQTISADPGVAGVPMILLTSSGGNPEAGRLAGISAFLTKPVRQSRLFDAIAGILGADTGKDPAAAETNGVVAVERTPVSTRPRVLVAEDNEVNQSVARLTLRKRGVEVDIAPNGLAAVEMSADAEYAAIFMDCQMPEMDGYDATRAIRRREGDGARIPIIAMTASAMQGDREECIDAGMDDYLTKPLRLDELDRTLQAWLGPANGSEAAVAGGGDTVVALASERIAELREALGDEETVAEVIDLYCADAVERPAELERALVADDLADLCRIAHALRGSSANVGAAEVSRLALEVERLAGNGEGEQLGSLIAQLSGEVPRAIAALRAGQGVAP